MGRIDEVLNGCKSVGANIDSIISKSVEVHKTEIIDLNRNTQLFEEGSRADNVLLPKYAPITRSLKQAPIPSHGRYTLYETGSFYSGFYMNINKDGYQINSKDSKTGELTDRLGKEIFGLNDENLSIANQLILPNVIDECKKTITI